MKTIDFPLEHPVLITPIHGKSHVAVSTTGHVEITEVTHREASEPRRVTMVDTGRARMKRTTADQFRIVEIRLPTEDATPDVFFEELDHLLEMYSLMYG